MTYWIVLGCFTLIALLNNFHGYRIMQTTASSFNTKFYFFTRSFLQLLYIYLSVTLISRRTLWWDEFSVDHEDRSEVTQLRVSCFVVALFSFAIYVILIIFAQRLIKVKSKTEFDAIRNADQQTYQEVNHSDRGERFVQF